MSTADAATPQPPPATAHGDHPAVAGRSLRARARQQRHALRVLTAHLAITTTALAWAVIATVLLFVLPLDDALTVWACLAAVAGATYGAVTFPRTAAGIALGVASAVAVLAVGDHYDVGTLQKWTVVAAAAVTVTSVFSTRRDLRGPYLPALAALLITVGAFTTAALTDTGWWWTAPALAAGAAAVGWRAQWSLTVAARRAGIRSGIKYRTGHHLAVRPEGDGRWMNEAHLDVGADAEAITATTLAGLGDRWHVLHSRALHNTAADADHIVVGPPGLFLVDSKYRSGHLECHPWVDDTGDTGVDWSYNGTPLDTTLVGSSLFEADKIAWAFYAEHAAGQPIPVVLAVHGARMNVPWGQMTIEILDADHSEDADTPPQVVGTKTVTIVDATHLADYLQQLPERRFTAPTKKELAAGREAGLEDAEVEARAQARYINDLATIADHVFIPVRG